MNVETPGETDAEAAVIESYAHRSNGRPSVDQIVVRGLAEHPLLLAPRRTHERLVPPASPDAAPHGQAVKASRIRFTRPSVGLL
jgi:hypothetical protein